MRSKTILVIDDQPHTHTLMQNVLGNAEHRVYTAFDATQGPMLARRLKPDLIILDIEMTGGGGRVVYERLRTMNNFLTVPILIYSGVGREHVEPRIHGHPWTLMLDKPARAEHILATVECMLDPQ